MWDLSSPTRERTLTPCIGRQSLNHWTARVLQHQVTFHNMLLFGPHDNNTVCLIGLSPFSRWNGCSPRLPPRASETKTLPCCFSPRLEFSPSSCTCDWFSFVYSGGENSALSPVSETKGILEGGRAQEAPWWTFQGEKKELETLPVLTPIFLKNKFPL